MTQPPKKYRKKVSDEQKEKALKLVSDFFSESGIFCYDCLPSEAMEKKLVEIILKDSADIIEGYNIEKFNAEWEEIE
jgi:hypothetical protein